MTSKLRELAIHEKMKKEDASQTARIRKEALKGALIDDDWEAFSALSDDGSGREWKQRNRKTKEIKPLKINMPPTIRTEPFEEVFFFPTVEDVKIAKRWLIRGEIAKGTRETATAIRLISERVAVPAKFLYLVRALEEDR